MLKLRKAQTLVEIVVASSILAVIAALAAVITARVYSSYEVIKAENEARKTIEEVLHTIAYGHEPGNGRGLIDATEINVIDTTDFNDITFTGQSGELIKYEHTGTTIDKTVDGADLKGLYISDDVVINDFQLAYLDNLGAPTTTATEVTQVKITIEAWVYIGAVDYRELTLYTSVRPLNLYTL